MPTATTVTFTNPRGLKLAGRLVRPDGPLLATGVFAHCFTGSKDLPQVRRLTEALSAHGIAMLAFDFPGLGDSEGDFAATTFSSNIDDLVAAAGHLETLVAAPSLLVGHSLGGAAVLAAAERIGGLDAVATIGAPADVDHVTHLFAEDLDDIRARGHATADVAGRRFAISASFVEDLRDHRLLDTVGRLDEALLFLHAPLDQTVAVDHARQLFEAAHHPKSFVSLADADHLLTAPADARYAAAVIAAWASRYLPAVAEHEDEVERASGR